MVPPAVCARGHALTGLLGPATALAEGEGLAACDCALRAVEGRLKNGSQPTLWRWVPARPRALSPIFPSQNRLAFALALRAQRQVEERDCLATEVADVALRAKQVAALVPRVRRSLAWLDRRMDASLAARAASIRRHLALVPPGPSVEAQGGPDGPESTPAPANPRRAPLRASTAASEAERVVFGLTSEDDLLGYVRSLAHQTGWLFYHPTFSIKGPSGFPDVVLVNERAGDVIIAELKREGLWPTRGPHEAGALPAGPDHLARRPAPGPGGQLPVVALRTRGTSPTSSPPARGRTWLASCA